MLLPKRRAGTVRHRRVSCAEADASHGGRCTSGTERHEAANGTSRVCGFRTRGARANRRCASVYVSVCISVRISSRGSATVSASIGVSVSVSTSVSIHAIANVPAGSCHCAASVGCRRGAGSIGCRHSSGYGRRIGRIGSDIAPARNHLDQRGATELIRLGGGAQKPHVRGGQRAALGLSSRQAQ